MSLTAFLAFCGGAAAQQVAVAPVEALPGETVALSIQLDTDGGSYTGLEFDIQFPCEGFTTTGTATVTAAWDGAFTIGDVGGVGISNLARCGVLSYSDTAIPGDGLQNLGNVEFTVGAGLATGDYTITLTNMTLVGTGRTSVSDASFTLSVVDVHTIVLDETSPSVPTASNGTVNVLVKRAVNAESWSTIVLPFDMTAAQVTSAFGTGVQLADFTGVENIYDNEDNVVGITVNFSSGVTAIEANHPYVIKVSSDITEFTVEGVTVEPDEDEAYIEFDNGKTGGRRVVYSGFYGTYHAGTVLDKFSVFLNNNKFYYSDGTVTMKGYRAYFEFLDVLTAFENDYPVKMFIDGVTTDMKMIDNEQGSADYIFDLSGRRVLKPEKQRLYIINGKKAVVK